MQLMLLMKLSLCQIDEFRIILGTTEVLSFRQVFDLRQGLLLHFWCNVPIAVLWLLCGMATNRVVCGRGRRCLPELVVAMRTSFQAFALATGGFDERDIL